MGVMAPPLHRPHGRPSPSHSLTVRVRELFHQNVLEEAQGKVYMNRLFKVPKPDSTESRFLLDLSGWGHAYPERLSRR